MGSTQKIIVMLFTLQLIVSASGIANVQAAMVNLCSGMKSLLPVTAMLMIVFAGMVYATGQVMGAETRARANVWATACLTGALIGVLIFAIAPQVLQTIYNEGGNEVAC